MTRSTVQKSVCALISIPMYGYIEIKLSLIAHAFFDQGDFSSTDILIDAYNNLNNCLNDGLQNPLTQYQIGLNLRDLILKWRNKILILFKLFLLQKKIICFGSPVRPMCSLILGIASLHPLLIEKGFKQVACVRTSRPMSPMPDFSLTMPIEEKLIDKAEEAKELNDEFSDEKPKTRVTIFQKQNNSNSVVELGKRSEKNSIPRDASVDALACKLFYLYLHYKI